MKKPKGSSTRTLKECKLLSLYLPILPLILDFRRHSTGRGGAANITPLHAPNIEGVPPPTAAHHQAHLHHGQEFYSSGRGGAGNIRSRSQSREPGAEGQRNKHPHVQSALGKILGNDG